MNHSISTLVAACAACTMSIAAQAQDVGALLKDADRFRMSADNLQVDTQVQTFNADGTPDKERRYTVFAQAGRQSLVLMQSPAEKGQKVLMLADDFWLLMPGSQRPLRITPMQKLLGDASTGDIATMSWVGDYTATLAGEEPCAPDAGAQAQADDKKQVKNASDALSNSKVCYHLHLVASRKGVTYQHIELWLGKQRHEPVRADLFVQSDKLAKQARFVMDSATAPTTVNAMVLVDQLSNKKETRITYLGRKEKTVPAEWLNPMFLARNPSLE